MFPWNWWTRIGSKHLWTNLIFVSTDKPRLIQRVMTKSQTKNLAQISWRFVTNHRANGFHGVWDEICIIARWFQRIVVKYERENVDKKKLRSCDEFKLSTRSWLKGRNDQVKFLNFLSDTKRSKILKFCSRLSWVERISFKASVLTLNDHSMTSSDLFNVSLHNSQKRFSRLKINKKFRVRFGGDLQTKFSFPPFDLLSKIFLL